MFSKQLIAFAAGLSSASAAYQGFNYGSDADFATEFATAKGLAGTDGAFTSARLYTMIEPGTSSTPTAAIQAAIDNDVTLLLGLWASAGQADIDLEIAALTSAIATYGTAFTSRVAGISVGSEDLYRISPTGILNKSGVGAEPADLTSYISQVRSAIAGTTLSGALVGHVDTWTAWVNGSNDAVTAACDFIGMDAYPYFQDTVANGIDDAYDLFFSAYDQTLAAAEGKPVWVTETGWPVSGANFGDAVPSTANAETYWSQVACKLLGTTNTWWYTLDDSGASPSFGVTTGSETPLYDLACSASSSSSSSSSAAATSTSSSAVLSSSTSVVASTSASATASASAASSSSAAGSASVSSVASSVASSAASTTASVSVGSSSQAMVSVSQSAVPTQGGAGSPADASSAAADSSASIFHSTAAAAYSSLAASASSVRSAASTDSMATIAASASSGEATSGAASASSGMATSASASAATGSGSVAVASGSSATGSGSSATGTSTSTSALPEYTGAASAVKSTGGLIAVVFAALAAL